MQAGQGHVCGFRRFESQVCIFKPYDSGGPVRVPILIDNEPYNIVDFQHHKPGKGSSVTRTKLKNLITGNNLEKTFKSGEKFPIPDVEYNEMKFLYLDDSNYHFMNPETYDQISIDSDIIGNYKFFLIEDMGVKVCFFNERAVGLEVPKTVNLKVTQTDPGLKGNTVSNTTKPATLQTGLVVQVPLHINEDDLLKINTEESCYIERVNS